MLIDEREARPGSDLISLVVQAQVDGQPLSADQKRGMVTLLFLGGLDTVTAMLSFIMAYLGQHPAQWQRLVQDPARIDQAIEELMRVHGVAGTERGVTQDMVFLQEWARRIPVFSVDAQGDLPTRGGLVWSPEAVPLVWPAGPASASVGQGSG